MQNNYQDTSYDYQATEEEVQESRARAEEEEKRKHELQKKALETCCYVAGSGAFGVFFRWLQTQIAFTEEGLVDKSALNWILVLYILVVAFVFIRFVDKMRNERYFVPDEFSLALKNPGRLFAFFRWFAGGLMFVGGLVLFATCEIDPEATLLRVIALLALISGLSFPFILGAANSDFYRPNMVCLFSVPPIVMYAVWLVTCYKANAINSVLWQYSIEVITVCVCMIGFFRTAGFAYSAPNWPRSMFFAMMGCSLCIMSLADGRNMGLQIILLSTALMFLLYIWIMIANQQRFEAPPKEYPNDGFERL